MTLNKPSSPLSIQPSKAFSTILSSKTLSNKLSLKSIIRDIKKTDPAMPISKLLKVSKVIKKLNTDPSAIVTSVQTKSVIKSMEQTDHLRSRYHGRAGSAIKQVQRMHKKFTENEVDSGGSSWRAAKLAEKFKKKHGRKEEKLRESRMRRIAVERRTEAENEIKEGSLEYKKWQGAAASIDEMNKVKDRARVGIDQDKNKDAKVSGAITDINKLSGGGVVDMMID